MAATGAERVVNWGQPAWTAPMYQPTTGMDHLGLASVSQDQILRALSPGINVLTVHPRYWSVYTWLLTEFWERDLPRTHAAWGRFLKPRERIFVAAVLSCPRHGTDIPEVAGKRRVGKEIDDGATEFDPGAPYLKNSRGGYPIYASAIAQLGLILLERDTAQFHCDAPTESGRGLGLTVRDWVGDTTYYRDHFDDTDVPVPSAVVTKFAERICLCRLTDGPDQPLVQDAFLHGGDPGDQIRRRASLRLICDLSTQTAAEPVEGWEFRQLIYYRADDQGRSFKAANPDIEATARRWRLYQHRELVAWACNRWLRRISLWGLDRGGDRVPIPFAECLVFCDGPSVNRVGRSAPRTSCKQRTSATDVPRRRKPLPQPRSPRRSGTRHAAQWAIGTFGPRSQPLSGYLLRTSAGEQPVRVDESNVTRAVAEVTVETDQVDVAGVIRAFAAWLGVNDRDYYRLRWAGGVALYRAVEENGWVYTETDDEMTELQAIDADAPPWRVELDRLCEAAEAAAKQAA